MTVLVNVIGIKSKTVRATSCAPQGRSPISLGANSDRKNQCDNFTHIVSWVTTTVWGWGSNGQYLSPQSLIPTGTTWGCVNQLIDEHRA